MTTLNRIKFWRQQRGWTLQQLAEAAGTTRAQIDKLERGTRRLTVDWMVRLAQPLGCDPRSLISTEHLAGLAEGAQTQTAPETPVPIYRLIAGPRGAKRSAKALRLVPRPYFLAQSPQAYGLLLAQDGLVPAAHSGQIAFIDPERQQRRGHLILLITTQARYHCGILAGKNPRQVVLNAPEAQQPLSFAVTDIASLQSVVALVDS